MSSEMFNDYLLQSRGITRDKFDKWPREAQTELQSEFIRNLTLSRHARAVDPRCVETAEQTREEYDQLRKREQAEAEAEDYMARLDPVKLLMGVPVWLRWSLLAVVGLALAWGVR